MTEKVYKDAKGVLYKVDAIGELGNADRSKLSILMLPVKPGATWRKKSLAPTFSLRCGKDAAQALDAMAEQNHWQLASEAEIQYNLTERAALLDDDSESTALYSLDISERTIRCLERAGIDTVEELAAMSDDQIMRIRDMGRKGYDEITTKLDDWVNKDTPDGDTGEQGITTFKELGLSEPCIKLLTKDYAFDDDDLEGLHGLLPEEREHLQTAYSEDWKKIHTYLQSDGTTEESSEDENPTPTDDLPWSAAATAAADQPADSPEPAVLTPTTETVAAVSEQADNATEVFPASGGAPEAFDYSGLSEKTVSVMHMAETEIQQARQGYIIRVSAAVAAVHEELVGISDKRSNQYSDSTFTKWCAYVGIKRDAAYRFLQVDSLLNNSTPEEAAQLEQASPSLLYAAAKPSAPAELVQAVKDGDITTHKQYKALEKQLAEERELRRQAEVGRDAAVKDVRQLEKEQAEDRQWMDSEIEKANQKADLAAKKSAEAWEQAAAEKQARKKAERELEESERLADDEIARVQRIADEATDRANTAEAKVKELESRPIEVTGADAADIARWRAEGAEQARQENAEVMAAMQEQLDDADAAQGNVVDALYIMVQQIAANCAAQLDNWSTAAACLTQDAYMDCVQQLDSLRIQILRMMMEGADNEEMS